MKKRWKLWIWILILAAVLLGSSMAIRAVLPDRLTDEEVSLLREELVGFWDSDTNFYADVLYDSQGTPLWMYGESADGCVILNRITRKFAEAGELQYYRDYHDVRKYYAPPLGHIVESKYVPNDMDSADEGFFFMGPNEHLDTFSPGVIGWIRSNLTLPFETLKSLMNGNTLPFS